MQKNKQVLEYKQIRIIQFLFKTYLDKTTAKKYYVILNVYQQTASEHLLAFIKEEVQRIRALPEFDPTLIKH